MVFNNEVSEFIFTRTYARWIPEKKRRETWEESVERYIDFIQSEVEGIPPKTIKKIRKYMEAFAVVPSMRLLWSAGDAARKDNTCLYNCAFACINCVESFAECLHILMCGTGFGFSVRQRDIELLPVIPKIHSAKGHTHTIEDSREGWADSVKILMERLYSGKNIKFDYSELRPSGARLHTMGGRSSGPQPLIKLHDFIREVFTIAQGRKLSTIEAHDICNQIAEIVVSGGVRRSSQISLSDLNDGDMRHAKDWPFPLRRAMANNSAIYDKKPTAAEFLREWGSLALSGTGERGVFNLAGARKTAPSRRYKPLIVGTNPCGEIMLRDMQFCNLSEIVVRPEDDLDTLLDKAETATWMGVIQSTFTDFPYLRKDWKKNCDVERLLGVSLTGQMDNPALMNSVALKALQSRVKRVSRKAAETLGINIPSATTCVKPSGTVSQLVDSASGVHPRWSEYYIRRFRISSSDPLFKMLKKQGVPCKPENGQKPKSATTWVLSFPIKAPEGCVIRSHVSALEQLEHYKNLQENWCEHNASMTVYVKDHEWFEVGNWVYTHWDIINGISFLPYDSGHYEQAPYEKITKKSYESFIKKYPIIDYSKLSEFELNDETEGAKEFACVGDKCEI